MDDTLSSLLDHACQVILGKRRQIELAVCCLLAQGHLLIEDIPGVGKTTLSHTLARLLGLSYQRVQFTSDLLPADILGAVIFESGNHRFTFHPGPIFNQIVLADEINRASPKTQSALLEAMEEYQVSIEGKTHCLPQPFFVIATQNPIHQTGTFPLPESQLDRFLMRISLGYPDRQAERALLKGQSRSQILNSLPVVLDSDHLLAMQNQIQTIHVSDPLLDYVQNLIDHTRQSPEYPLGLSPRAGLSLLQAAKAWAFMEGRDCVYPDDIQMVLGPVTAHRLQGSLGVVDAELSTRNLIEQVPIP